MRTTRGKLITNLTKNDFKIFEDDKPQTIKSFTRDTDLPLSIALLVDASGSIIEQLKFERAAATDFFFNTVKRKKDRAAVIAFDSVISILSNETADGFYDEPERLADAVRKIKAGGGTSVYDAVYGAVQKMLSKEKGERRKLVILISDGDDTASKLSLTEAIEMAQRQRRDDLRNQYQQDVRHEEPLKGSGRRGYPEDGRRNWRKKLTFH